MSWYDEWIFHIGEDFAYDESDNRASGGLYRTDMDILSEMWIKLGYLDAHPGVLRWRAATAALRTKECWCPIPMEGYLQPFWCDFCESPPEIQPTFAVRYNDNEKVYVTQLEWHDLSYGDTREQALESAGLTETDVSTEPWIFSLVGNLIQSPGLYSLQSSPR